MIHADLPGIDPQHIDVTLEKGALTIRGRRVLEVAIPKQAQVLPRRISVEAA